MTESLAVSRRWTSRSQCTTCGSSTGATARPAARRSWQRRMNKGTRSRVDRGAPCRAACSSSQVLEASLQALLVSQPTFGQLTCQSAEGEHSGLIRILVG